MIFKAATLAQAAADMVLANAEVLAAPEVASEAEDAPQPASLPVMAPRAPAPQPAVQLALF
ncbi:hypothetical protein [Novosphingobium sp. FKTRR1]|uniref:hypothetical protein n=1 Tax=Novosphingobium sp. FKTRR1 TaxID=2879118 RepID=UPI0021065CB9|nr:hypothetical protein [Novosphingobium sp. FKTRR1]